MAESADRSLTPCNPIPAQDRAMIGVGADKQKIRITVRLIRLFGGTPAGFSFPVPETEGIPYWGLFSWQTTRFSVYSN